MNEKSHRNFSRAVILMDPVKAIHLFHFSYGHARFLPLCQELLGEDQENATLWGP